MIFLKIAANAIPTKRNILSVISTVHNPLEYLQPFTIQLKMSIVSKDLQIEYGLRRFDR